ncbi:MAG: GumC family protein [Alphaproteobacteria bacterium]
MNYRAVTWQAGTHVPADAARAEAAHLAEFVSILRKRRRLIVRIAAAFVVATLVVLAFVPTLYSASAVVVLEGRKNSVADQSAVLSSLPTDPASVQNQVQVLTSRGLAARVIGKLKLWRDPEFNRALAPNLLDIITGEAWQYDETGRERDAIVKTFLRRLSVDSQGLSSTITITFSSRSAEKSARIANAIADAYIEGQIEAKSAAAEKASQWLADRIQQLSDQAQAAEAAVENYKKENGLSEGADGTPLVNQQIAAMNTQLVQARSELAQKQATYDRMNALVKAGRGADISQVVSSPLIVELRKLQADLIRQEAQLATRYGPLHPKIIDMQSEKQNLEAKISQEVSRLMASVANELAITRAQVKSLEDGLKRAEGQAGGENMTRVKLRALQVNAVSTRSMYEAFVSRLRETQNLEDIQASDAQIISRALVPSVPSTPPKPLVLVASIPIGLLLGAFVALLTERFGPALRRSPIARLFRGLPVLAHVPGARHARAADQVADVPGSDFATALMHLAGTLAPQTGSARVIVVTSAEHGEGKTAIALGLARAAAQRGLRTVVVDADLDWPAMAGALGFTAQPRGLADVLAAAAPLSRTMFRDPRSPVLMLAGMRKAPNAARLLESGNFAQLIAHLRRRADMVIVDAPPVLGADRLRFVVPIADAVLLAVCWEGAGRPAVDSAIGALAAMRSPPAGVVIAA